MGATISLAKQESTDIIQHIDDVDKGEEVYFTCVGCGKEMIAVKSVARKRDWHFRHKIESNCTGGRDTALHDYAVQVIMSAKEIVVAQNLKIDYSNPKKEVVVFNKRSDIAIIHENNEVHIEVFVTHGLDAEKELLYKKNEIKSILIDLSHSSWLTAEPDKIREAILKEHKNKRVIFWERNLSYENKNSFSLVNAFLWALSAIGLLILFRGLSKRNRIK